MNHILDPCYGCQPYPNCKTTCDKWMFYNLYLTEKQKLEQIENTFHSKIDECLKNFPEYWNNKHSEKERQFNFQHDSLIQEFVRYIKQNIGG